MSRVLDMIGHGVVAGAVALVGCGVEPAPTVAVTGASTLAACAVPGTTQLVLRNAGGGVLAWQAAVEGVPGLRVAPESGELVAKGEEQLVLTVPRQFVGRTLEGSLIITSNDPLTPRSTVPVSVVRSGPLLTPSSSELDFGVMPVGVEAPVQVVSLKNLGNIDARVSLAELPSFGWTWQVGPAIPAGGVGSVAASFKPASVGTFEHEVRVDADGHCGSPSVVRIRGKGTDGIVGVSPGLLDFGDVDCGSISKLEKTIKVYNASKQPFDVATTVSGSIFQLASAATTTVAGESSIDVKVAAIGIPKAAPPTKDYWKGRVHIETTAPKDTPHDVDIVATPHGGVLIVSPATPLDFGKREVATKKSLPFTVDNFGNATVTLAAINQGAFSFAGGAVVPGQTSAFTLEHESTGEDLGKQLDVSLPFTTTDPLCAPVAQPLRGRAYAYEFPQSAAAMELINRHECAIGKTGRVYCWGENASGQLGDGSNQSATDPVKVKSITNAVGVSVGADYSCASLANGEIWCWGYNGYGALGNGTTISSNVPVKVLSVNDAVKVATAFTVACALRKTGEVACWGFGTWGEIGNGTKSQTFTTPVPVTNLFDAVGLDAQYQQVCALRANGNGVVCWGQTNTHGTQVVPQPIMGTTAAVKITVDAGGCYVDANGAVACWGPWDPSVKPVTGLPPASQVSGGGTRCAVSNVSIYCWGNNYHGWFGDGMSSDGSPTPTFVRFGTFVSVGFATVLAISGSELFRWGRYGQVILKPQVVPGFSSL